MNNMAMRVSMSGFLGLPDDWKPTAEDIAAKMRLDFESSVFKRMRQMGMKKKDLAERVDKSPAAISKMLSGKSNLTIKTISKIASALDCTVSFSLEERKPLSSYFGERDSSDPQEVTFSAPVQTHTESYREYIFTGSGIKPVKVSESYTAHSVGRHHLDGKVDAA